jgi:hypothetical protein
VPDSQATHVLPRPWPQGAGWPASLMEAWSGGYWDSRRRELGVIGGGHGDGALNLVIAFGTETLAWRRVTEPSPAWPAPSEDLVSTNPDGTPVARHTYGGLAYAPALDRIWMFSGSNWYIGRPDALPWLLDPETRTWQRRAAAPRGGFDVSAAWDPVRGEVVYKLIAGVYAHDPVKDTHRVLHTPWESLEAEHAGSVDPVARYFYAIGHRQMFRVPLDHRAPRRLEFVKPAGDTEILAAYQPGFVYDPDGQRFIAWSGGADVYTFDLRAPAPAWKRQTLAGPRPREANPRGTFGRFQYIGDGLVIVVTATDRNVFVGRLAPVTRDPAR